MEFRVNGLIAAFICLCTQPTAINQQSVEIVLQESKTPCICIPWCYSSTTSFHIFQGKAQSLSSFPLGISTLHDLCNKVKRFIFMEIWLPPTGELCSFHTASWILARFASYPQRFFSMSISCCCPRDWQHPQKIIAYSFPCILSRILQVTASGASPFLFISPKVW